MNARRPGLRSLWIALAAIAGTLWVGGDVSACQMKPALRSIRACCTARPVGECGCCGETRSAPADVLGLAEATRTPSASTLVVGSSASSCECREGDPAAPTDKPSQRPSESRSDDGRLGSLAAHFTPLRACTTPHRSIEPTASPPKAPIYLRTSHLLF